MEESVAFTRMLNTWDVKLDVATEHWSLAMPVAYRQFEQSAALVFLKSSRTAEDGTRFFRVADEWEADDTEHGKLALADVRDDRTCWVT